MAKITEHSHSVRQGNIELMRVVAMFLVVLGHVRWCYLNPNDISTTEFSILKILTFLINFHVDSFVLITGYFGIKNFKKTFFRNLCLVFFYLIILNILSYSIGGGFDWRHIIMPISHGPWWFMTCYLLLLMVAPILDNAFSCCTNKERRLMWFLIMTLTCYFGFVQRVEYFYNTHFNFFVFIAVYSTGIMLRYESLVTQWSKRMIACIFILLELLQIAIACIKHNINIQTTIDVGDYGSPLTIALAVCFFCLFKKFTIPQTSIIKFFAQSAVAVYLITEFPLVRNLLNNLFSAFLPENALLHIVYFPVFALVLYLGCTLVDQGRIAIFKLLSR